MVNSHSTAAVGNPASRADLVMIVLTAVGVQVALIFGIVNFAVSPLQKDVDEIRDDLEKSIQSSQALVRQSDLTQAALTELASVTQNNAERISEIGFTLAEMSSDLRVINLLLEQRGDETSIPIDTQLTASQVLRVVQQLSDEERQQILNALTDDDATLE